MSTSAEPVYGERVLIPFGHDSEILGTVCEVYGPKGRRHVLVLLEPESSDYVVAEPTTVAWPLAEVRRVAAAS